MRRSSAVAVVLALDVAVALAQARPDFSGTWTLDPSRSRVVDAAGLAGLSAAGAPGRLHITQPANGTLVIESQINEGHARLYRPGSSISTPVTLGQTGSVAMTSRWKGRALVSEGTRESAGGVATQVEEVVSLSSDGRTLTIEVTTTAGGDRSASTLAYTRTQALGPCRNWPTPCKTPAR
jgi:hypothetical protein